MKTKAGNASGNGWAWVPVLATVLVATLVPGIPEDRGAGRAYAQAEPTNTPAPPTALPTETSTPGPATETPIPPTPTEVPPTGTPGTATPTFTPTNTPTNTPTFTPTNTPTNTPTFTPTSTPTNTPTNTPTFTPTNTPTNTPTFTPTSTPTLTPTSMPTNTPTSTPTSTPTNTPTSTPTPTVTPTTTPTVVPTAPPAVDLGATTAVPGQALLASGSVPDTALSYQLCLIANATWTLGAPFGGVCTLSAPLTSPTNAFTGAPLGPAPGAGSYDLLLLGPASTVLAADDASSAPGLVVTGLADVPVGGGAGLLGFAFLIAAGAWVLLRQFR